LVTGWVVYHGFALNSSSPKGSFVSLRGALRRSNLGRGVGLLHFARNDKQGDSITNHTDEYIPLTRLVTSR
jgi:hypothetical protein